MSDLIDRQAAIELIHSLYPSTPIMRRNRERWEEKYKPYIEAEKALEMLPSAQPERKTGRWIHDGYAFRGGIDWMHCSECGHKDSWSAATRTPFCAWCGARMEGEG